MSWDFQLKNGKLEALSNKHLPEIEQLFSHQGLAESQARSVLTAADAKKQLQQMLDDHQQTLAAYWLVRDKKNQLVGLVGLHSFNWANGSAQLTVELFPEYRSKGFLYDACWTLIDIAFNRFELKRIEAMVLQGNRALYSYMKRVKFVYEGLLPARSTHQGQWLNYHLFSMLKNDQGWLQQADYRKNNPL